MDIKASHYPGALAEHHEVFSVIVAGRRRNFAELEEASEFFESRDDPAAFVVTTTGTFVKEQFVRTYQEVLKGEEESKRNTHAKQFSEAEPISPWPSDTDGDDTA